MSNYRPIDSKREEFRKYLERAGVMDALTKVLVSLYEETEKPDDALDYVRKHLSDSSADTEETETLRAELENNLAKIEALEEENAALKLRLKQYEGSAEGLSAEGVVEGEEGEEGEPESAPPPVEDEKDPEAE